ncbi:transcriptional regulator [Oleidesulfovibrio sp.]|uniref:transcriptional regulator n=1 Tax=Oleidesulfovibrio sp. TaxID=2909707 RepID=UPI003A8619A1
MLKWLIIIVAGYLLFRMLTNDQKRKSKDGEKEKERMYAAGEMVKDPICGAYVEKDGGISVRDGETIHRFCSYDCRDKFLEQLQGGGREIPEAAKHDAD